MNNGVRNLENNPGNTPKANQIVFTKNQSLFFWIFQK